jgi:pseudomonalisin/xanthomonalisin
VTNHGAHRSFTVVFAAVLAATIPFGTIGAVVAKATPPASLAKGETVLTGTVPPVVSLHRATRLSAKNPLSTMSLSLSLPFRNEAALDRFLGTSALHGRYMSQQEFDRRFGASAAQVAATKEWAARNGLAVTFVSRDGTTIGVRGITSSVETAFRVRINQYRYGKRVFFAPSSKARQPAGLALSAVVGLDSFEHMHTLGVRKNLIRDGGYYPADFRVAYDVSGHGIDGTGQTIGLTLWGPQPTDQDFANLAAGQTNDTGVTDPTLKSCVKCSSPDRIEWLRVDGPNKDHSGDVTEASMDAEFSHGMALHSHLRFYMAPDASDSHLVDTIARAANDPKIHIVSDSWGGGPYTSAQDPFVKATTQSFKHAVAVGTTFYFSSGDTSQNSGCPVNNKTGQPTDCTQASYPADSPWVVSVGGTNLQVNQNVTWNSETVWNSDPNNGFEGGGTGCTTIFPRPSWQKSTVNLAATCSGRAEPDLSAAGDPETGAHVYAGGTNGDVGGTSLAAPLTSGMAALTNAYLIKQHKKLLGFAAPEIYKLGTSKYANTYFHDVRCGFNGFPAGPGWDQASGFGSVDWYEYARGFAGLPVPSIKPKFSTCTQVTKLAQLADPFDGFLAWPTYSRTETSKTVSVSSDDSSSNLMRALHPLSYKASGVVGSVLQTDSFDVEGDGSFSKTGELYYRASLLHNNYQAAAMVQTVRNKFKAGKPSDPGTNCLYNGAFPEAPVDCYIYGIFKLKNGQAAFYDMLAEQNAVIEVLATTSYSNIPNGSDQQQNFADGISLVIQSGIAQVNSVTNSGYGEKYVAQPDSTPRGIVLNK